MLSDSNGFLEPYMEPNRVPTLCFPSRQFAPPRGGSQEITEANRAILEAGDTIWPASVILAAPSERWRNVAVFGPWGRGFGVAALGAEVLRRLSVGFRETWLCQGTNRCRQLRC